VPVGSILGQQGRVRSAQLSVGTDPDPIEELTRATVLLKQGAEHRPSAALVCQGELGQPPPGS
jgi:hypothetical protein